MGQPVAKSGSAIAGANFAAAKIRRFYFPAKVFQEKFYRSAYNFEIDRLSVLRRVVITRLGAQVPSKSCLLFRRLENCFVAFSVHQQIEGF